MPNFSVTLFDADRSTFSGQAALDWFAANRDPKMKISSGKGKSSMTAETRSLQNAMGRIPRENTRPGRAYDERRAYEYMRQITGHEHWRAEWDGDRIRYVRGADGERREIPHWDWNGHNDTVEDCELRFEFAA